MSRLSIWLLGPIMAEVDGKRLSGFRSDKVRALLAYLSVESHRPWARTTLAGLLWPDNSEKAALSNLRNALSNLRRVFGNIGDVSPFFNITQRTIQFNPPSDSWLDVKVFSDHAAKQDALDGELGDVEKWECALSLYRGEFMEGFSIGSAPFEEWMLSTRERFRQQLLQTIRALVVAHELSGKYIAVLDYSRRWIELEPWDEDAHRHRMRILAGAGQRNSALAQYEELRSRLSQDLRIAPEPKTTHLYEQIRDGQSMPFASASTKAAETDRNLAVDPGPIPKFIVEELSLVAEPKLFVSRKKELQQLENRLEQTVGGRGGVFFVRGEPGSGKTTLLGEFSHLAIQNHSNLLALWGQCNAYTGLGDPYFPFLTITRMLIGDVEPKFFGGGVITLKHIQQLWRYLPDTITSLVEFGPDLISRFLAGENSLRLAQEHQGVESSQLTNLSSHLKGQAKRGYQTRLPQVALFEQFTRVMTALSRSHPLLIVLDDLQWIDTGSLNLFFHMGRQLTNSKIMLVGTYRPEEVETAREDSSHPLDGIVRELQAMYGETIVDLARSEGMNFVNAILDSEPNELSPEFRRSLYQRTSGNPLFTIELLRGMQLREEIIKDKNGVWVEGQQLNWDQLPVKVEAVISHRIQHLSHECQSILSAACVVGEQFTSSVTAHVAGMDEYLVQNLLSQEIGKQYHLVTAQGLSRVGDEKLSTYRFRHSLYQTYLYNHLDSVEKAQFHGKVGEELEKVYGSDEQKTSEFAHTIARHFELGSMIGKAVQYFNLAGQNALHLSANQEALTHFYHALELLRSLPPSSERDRQELGLQLSLGHPLTALKGWAPPEMVIAYERAQELCQNISDNAQLVPFLWLLATYFLGRSEHATVDHLVGRLSHLAQQAGDPMLIALAGLQVSPFYQGRFCEARELLEIAGSFRDLNQQRQLAQQFGMAPAVVGMAYLAECLWFLGFPEQAYKSAIHARKMAEQIQHPLTSCYVFGRASWLYAANLDLEMLQDQSTRLQIVAQKYGFRNFELASTFFENWVNIQNGRSGVKAIKKMQQMIETYHATGTILNRTGFLVLFAQACCKFDQTKLGLDAVNESMRLAEKTSELWCQSEAYRVKGELLIQQNADLAEAEEYFLNARKVAVQQQAKMLELRATMSLCRLWQAQGRVENGKHDLAMLYNTFTEGFDSPDMVTAKKLMDTKDNALIMR